MTLILLAGALLTLLGAWLESSRHTPNTRESMAPGSRAALHQRML